MDKYKLFKQVKQDEDELNNVYYGNSNLMSNFTNFSTILKKDEILKKEKLIPLSEVELYYNNQGVKQVFKPYQNSGIYRHILAFYPFERMFMDTMYIRLGKSTLAFCNIIDLFSKYAYSKLFIIGEKAQAITSNKSVETLKGFISEINKYGFTKQDMGCLVLDAGNEFLGDCLHYLNENKILYNYANAGDKKKMSPIERFNGTLRLYLEKYRVIYGKINTKVLSIILNAYNNVKHAHLDYSPIEILKSKEAQTESEKVYINMDKENHMNGLYVGQSVRVLIDRGPFKKIKPIWSNEIYIISKILNNSNYQIKGLRGFYHLTELQAINTDFLMNDNKVNVSSLPPNVEKDALPTRFTETNDVIPSIPIVRETRIRKAPNKLNI